ncbi:hypothetical protein F4820DRAFT_323183 [Hypoxylon rubiginosum]|uniref:Uncharacterized protein n=1 Tax=Hypoxylon rubiginosum TaxID=110542 RepID=A0ACB9Z041_9PEZI|nr:hypothetical protein F4820DRAFT_323183 [Hypoxylon rubiginosum]
MSQPSQCFIDQVTAPIRLIDVLPLHQHSGVSSRRELSTVPEIEEYLSRTDPGNYSHRHLSICQKTSWRPLQITRGLLELFVSKNGISDSFWELPSCFYYRNDDVEINYCLPVNVNRRGSLTEVYYTIRYPEQKPDSGNWVIRQSGLYFRIDTATYRTISVLFSPTPNSAAHRKIEGFLLGTDSGTKPPQDPLYIHKILFAAYFPAWRQYVAYLERSLIPETSTTFTTLIEEPLRVGYDNLSTLTSLDSRFLQVSTLLSQGEDVLRELSSAFSQGKLNYETAGVIATLDNYRRQAVACCRTAAFLQRRAQTTAQLLANTLSLRDQILAKQQNSSMLQLNKSAVFLTTLTLLYLPASFVATIFGMNFFDLDQESHRIVSTPMVWIYVVSSAMLTLATFSVYHWVLRHDDAVVTRMSPKIHVGDWKALARRAITMRADSVRKLESIPV